MLKGWNLVTEKSNVSQILFSFHNQYFYLYLVIWEWFCATVTSSYIPLVIGFLHASCTNTSDKPHSLHDWNYNKKKKYVRQFEHHRRDIPWWALESQQPPSVLSFPFHFFAFVEHVYESCDFSCSSCWIILNGGPINHYKPYVIHHTWKQHT